MNAYRSKPLNFPWPILLYSAAILTALVLDHFVPLPLPAFARSLAFVAGGLLTIGAILLGLWAAKTLIDSETTISTHRCTTYLVTRGPFRYTRNPTYLGYTLVTIGFGLLTGNAWFFLSGAVAALATTAIVIRSEEMHLLSRFGFEFEHYCRRTRRWV